MTKENMHYADYLQLDKILNAQKLESESLGRKAHDEMIFIVIHQVYELWFKQILFELGSINELFAQETLDDKKLGLISSRLERVNQIFKTLVNQISIIETITPMNFLEFRDLLSPASGFQSLQFRLLESMLGITKGDRTSEETPFFDSRLSTEEKDQLKKALAQDSLVTNVNKWLERMPFIETENFSFWDEYKKVVKKMLHQDQEIVLNNPTLSQSRKDEEKMKIDHMSEDFFKLFDKKGNSKFSNQAVLSALFISLYQDFPLLHLPFKILNQMIDLDKHLTQWRQGHALMAKRMLGSKIGTGGSAGHQYLKRTAQKHTVFSDLFLVSSYLIPKNLRPKLPSQMNQNLSYHYNVSKNIL